MSKLYRYTIVRRSIVEERYTVEADCDQAAVDDHDLDYDNGKVGEEFIDWYDEDWRIVNKETLCPLTKMIKQHDTISPCGTATASST